MKAWQLGRRRLLAATCRKCGKLCQAASFSRHWRNRKGRYPYIDRRCADCRWGHKLHLRR